MRAGFFKFKFKCIVASGSLDFNFAIQELGYIYISITTFLSNIQPDFTNVLMGMFWGSLALERHVDLLNSFQMNLSSG
jgi:hypothetical protein